MKNLTLVLLLFLILSVFTLGNSMAQDIGFKGVGGRLGFVDPEGPGGSTIFLGGHADLGEIVSKLVLYPSIEFSRKNSVTFIAINGDTRYYFNSPGKIKPFAGGGLAILYSNGSGFSNTDIGLDLLGGVEYPIAPNLVTFGKIKYTLSDGNVFRLTGGISVILGK